MLPNTISISCKVPRFSPSTFDRSLSPPTAQIWPFVQVGSGADWFSAIATAEETTNRERIAMTESNLAGVRCRMLIATVLRCHVMFVLSFFMNLKTMKVLARPE
jgi:hypothetical protein